MSQSDAKHRFDTLAIHAGQAPDPTTGAIMTPVYFTSTYVQDGPSEHKGYEYSRTHNPTRKALQDCLATNVRTGCCHGPFLTGVGPASLLARAPERPSARASDRLRGRPEAAGWRAPQKPSAGRSS